MNDYTRPNTAQGTHSPHPRPRTNWTGAHTPLLYLEDMNGSAPPHIEIVQK